MSEIIEARTLKFKTGKRCVRLTYKDETFEEFEVVRGSICWPHGIIPGLVLIGGLLRETEVVKVLEETPFSTLPEAKKILIDHKAKYSDTLYCIYYQNIPESEGFIKYFSERDQYPDPPFTSAPYSENIDYGIQLVSSCLADKKLKVPREGLLATQLQTGWENVSSEKNLHGVIALACLIAGIQARFEGPFSEDMLERCSGSPYDYDD